MFRVVRCSNCLLFQVTGASKALRCLRCSKSKVISSLKIYFRSESAKDCQLVLAKLKEDEFMAKDENHDDFFSYNNSRNSSEKNDDLLNLDFK